MDFRRASHELFLKKGVPHQFSSGWENLRNTSIKKSKYDPQTLKHYFIQLKYYLYTSVK